jgi:beta-glucanase (GH16 family)
MSKNHWIFKHARPRCTTVEAAYREQLRRRLRFVCLAIVCSAPLLSACGTSQKQAPAPTSEAPSTATTPMWQPGPGWQLSWSSDFSGADPLRDWSVDTSGNGWGGKQLQYYSAANVVPQRGGGISLKASANGSGERCWYGTCKYLSGRIETKGLFQQKYGIFSAYIKLPSGTGLWPAFWMQGVDASTVPWPHGGEIDVIEENNKQNNLAEAFVHSPQVNKGFYYQLPAPLSAGYHAYSIEWTPDSLSWMIDGHQYGHVKISSESSPFNQPFYLILDLAVGGVWPGSPDASTVFPAEMDIAWVHVYRQLPQAR